MCGDKCVSVLKGTSRGPNVTSQFKFSCGFACRRRAVLRKTIFHPICAWKSTGSHVTCRCVTTGTREVTGFLFDECWNLTSLYFLIQGYLPPTKNGVEPKRPSRPINITSLVRLSTTVPNTIVVSWTAEIGRVRIKTSQFLNREVWKGKGSWFKMETSTFNWFSYILFFTIIMSWIKRITFKEYK